MSINIALPQVNEKPNAKDYVISILSTEWPLNPRQIHSKIKSVYGYDITYQAAYKMVQELLKQSVLSKKDNKYELDLKWIKELHRYTEVVETNYYTKNRLNLIDGIKDAKSAGDLSILTFETYFDVEKYLYYMQKHYISNSKHTETIIAHHKNEWRPIFYLRAEYNWAKKIQELGAGVYVLCSGNSIVDRWCASFYNKIGANVKTGINVAETNELMVFGDYVIQVYIPDDIHKKIEETYRKAGKVDDINLAKMFEEIFGKKTEIKVIINKDKKLASQLKENTLAYFRK